MRRTAILYAVSAVLVAANWLRLEDPHVGAAWLLAVGLALVPALVRPPWLRALLAAAAALALSLLDKGLWDRDRDFAGPLFSQFRGGFLEYYDVSLPFDGAAHPRMHGVLVLAIFTFCLAVGLAIAARRAVLAGLILVVGAGWPATLMPGGNELLRGALILGGALLLFVALSTRDWSVLAQGLFAVVAVSLAALVASNSPAVAKDEFLNWQSWDFYTKAETPVGVRYVWDSRYDGIRFPTKKTVVLEVKAPPRRTYWRATTLDEFDGRGWIEDLARIFPLGGALDATGDPLVPSRARERRGWIEQEVTVEGLRDRHLVAASIPLFYQVEPGQIGDVVYGAGGVALAPGGVPRGATYRVWSFAARPTPSELAQAPAEYPAGIELGGYLNVLPGLEAPIFGSKDYARRVSKLWELAPQIDRRIVPYKGLYEQARAVVGRARSPYAATIALEAWFRSGGGFTYDETPPRANGRPPLVDFVLRSKHGYCQHFAGAMALMLRYLGIPARVAAGFTSGRYNADSGTWTVTDHEAHTWVEVWFPGWGWLPFDPTPSRGTLSASYTASSLAFDVTEARGFLGQLSGAARNAVESSRQGRGAQPDILQGPDGRPDGALGTAASLVTRKRGESLLRLLAVAGLVVALAIVLVKLAVRNGRFLTRDPRRIAAACRRELVDVLNDQGIRVPPGATLAELGELLASELGVDAGAFVETATVARFGPPREARAAARSARRDLRRAKRMIRRRLTAVERARGLLSLRSLGFTS